MKNASDDYNSQQSRFVLLSLRLDQLELQNNVLAGNLSDALARIAVIEEANSDLEIWIGQGEAGAEEQPSGQNESAQGNETAAANETAAGNETGESNQTAGNNTSDGGNGDQKPQPSKRPGNARLLDVIAYIKQNGLQIGQNWQLVQNGEDLWVQNNSTEGQLSRYVFVSGFNVTL